MKASGNPTSPKQLKALLKKGEGQSLEFKRSTAELQGAMQSLCAFMNGAGGMVIIGVGPDGRLIGQDVSDATHQKIAAALDRFEPPAQVTMESIDIGQGRQIIVFKAEGAMSLFRSHLKAVHMNVWQRQRERCPSQDTKSS